MERCTGAVTYTPNGAPTVTLSPQMTEATLDQMTVAASECDPGLICDMLILNFTRTDMCTSA